MHAELDAATGPGPAGEPLTGEQRESRFAATVDAYLAALGFTDELLRERWRTVVCERGAASLPAPEEDEIEEAAVEQTCLVLDAWLGELLQRAGRSAMPQAAPARRQRLALAALLGGANPGWTRRFASRPYAAREVDLGAFLAGVEAGLPRPMPAPAPLEMTPEPLQLRRLALGERLRRLLGPGSPP